MNIQTRKIEFIQKFLSIKNEDVIRQLEELLNRTITSERKHKALSDKEFIARVERAIEASENGKTYSHEEVKKIVSEWA